MAMADDQVSLSSLADEAGLGARLPPLQKIGYDLARLVLMIIGLTMLVIFWASFWLFPLGSPPVPPTGLTSDTVDLYKATLEAYRAASDTQISRATGLFTAVVGTALLPAFTAILGYIFGKASDENGS
jgi:drug/metabolite transporter (DMT)-like permease